jgi:hypothetical protein
MKRLLAGLLSLSLGWGSGCASVAPLQLLSLDEGPVLVVQEPGTTSATPEIKTEISAGMTSELRHPDYLPSSSDGSDTPVEGVVQVKFTDEGSTGSEITVIATEPNIPQQPPENTNASKAESSSQSTLHSGIAQLGYVFSQWLPWNGSPEVCASCKAGSLPDCPSCKAGTCFNCPGCKSGTLPDCPSCKASNSPDCSSCKVASPPCGNYGWSKPTGDADRFYASGEYLLWWIRNTNVPPLVTTSAPNLNGIIGPGTTILLGQSPLDNQERSGGRLTVGYWLDNCKEVGIEASGFFLEDRCVSFPFSSNQSPVLARPFFDVNNNRESAQVAASPGLGTGSITTTLCSELWGLEVNARCNLCCGCNYRVDLLGGFRFLDLEEKLDITEDINATVGGSVFGGDHVVVSDHFATRNKFFGAQIGAVAEWERGNFFVEFRGKLGLGDTHQMIDVSGNLRITPSGGPTTTVAGGLLALNSNSGHFSKDQFSVVPELGLNVGYKVTENLRAFVGYNFLYWTDVVRPGDQIDRKLDINRIPFFSGPPTNQVHPVVPFKESDFWAQGINVGVQFRF